MGANRSQWEEARLNLGSTRIFHSWDWLQLHAEHLGTKLDTHIIGGSRPKALLPLMRLRRGPWDLYNWSSFPYLGPVIDLSQPQTALSSLLNYCPSGSRAAVVNLSFSPADCAKAAQADPTWMAPAIAQNYTAEAEETYTFDLAQHTEDSLWMGLQSRRRRYIRRARKEGVTVREATSFEYENVATKLHQDHFAHINAHTPYTPEFLKAIRDTFGPEVVRTWVAVYQEQIVGFYIALVSGDTVEGWKLGSLPEFDHLRIQSVLQWEAIRWAKAQSFVHFDMIGLLSSSMAQFKKTFGGELTDYRVLRAEPSSSYRAVRSVGRRVASYPAANRVINRHRVPSAARVSEQAQNPVDPPQRTDPTGLAAWCQGETAPNK